MKKSTVIIAALVVLFLIFGMNGCSSYNGMVEKQWHQIENQYQRRMDLIPNLVATVKNVAEFEKSTLEAVIQARASATQVTIDPSKLDAESMKKYEEAQGAITQSLGRLLVVSENYPELKATESFRDLQVQLEGTENRITTERGRFNEVVQDYNTTIKKFPRNIWAGMFGFSEKSYFQAKEGAENAPDVNDLFKK
jgi:LemA protein